MEIALNAETTQRIRDVLGADVDLAPDRVPGVLARLAVEAPAVYSQVLGELSGSQIRLDSEEEFRRRRRRGVLRRLLFSWGEYETEVGDRLLEKRHIAAAVPLALAVLTMVLLAFSLAFGRRQVPRPAPGTAAVQRQPGPLVVRQETELPPVLVPRQDPTRNKMIGAAPPLYSSPLSGSSAAGMLPVAVLPPGLPGPADVPGLGARSLGSPVVVSQEGSPARAGRSGGEFPTAAVPPVVYNRATEVESTRRETTDADGEGFAKASGSPRGTGTAGGAAQALAPGIRLPATLVTGAIVIPGGSPVPVVVETAEPHGVWTGQAVLGPGNRVQVTLTLATQNRASGARGMVLDPDRLVPGLLGRTTVRYASAAAAMATAGLQAASDYAQAAARQGSISVFDGLGSIVVGGQLPEAWTFLAARVAREFQAHETPGGLVTTTEVPAGAQLIILVTEASAL
jgi:hypothetical protein